MSMNCAERKAALRNFVLLLVLTFTLGVMASCETSKATMNSDKANIEVRDTVIAECRTTIESIRTENEQLKKDVAEKDKKIIWLRKKAKDAGADLTK